ncbi:alanine and proline-rich secreted protein Apa-like [Panicum virgatum]|uniref:alanine and proline-rich secreted protein Apa-like n=1 Tax=Panicum virgatum TaxID=38727 RepID=UPI0019D59A79|nr:alanine and proline-rich secreted protein Apa-like [Panicum virgatum]
MSTSPHPQQDQQDGRRQPAAFRIRLDTTRSPYPTTLVHQSHPKTLAGAGGQADRTESNAAAAVPRRSGQAQTRRQLRPRRQEGAACFRRRLGQDRAPDLTALSAARPRPPPSAKLVASPPDRKPIRPMPPPPPPPQPRSPWRPAAPALDAGQE